MPGCRSVRYSAWLCIGLCLSGCVAFSELGERSTDISEIRVGMHRDEVEKELGKCRGVAPDAEGRVHCSYHVRDIDHRPFVRAGTLVVDVLTLGLVSGICGSGFACDMTDERFSRLHLVYAPDGTLESYVLESDEERRVDN